MRLRTIVGALSFGALIVAPQIAEASSHREAPFVSKNPKVDGTDLYAFESYEVNHSGMVTIIANYQPLQDAYGGPNYFGLDPDALYEIEIDNDGDGVEDYTFQFTFKTVLGGTNNAGFSLHIGPDGGPTNAVPFYNVGLIPNSGNTGSSAALNVVETYSVNLVKGPRRGSAGTAVANPGGTNTFNKPADNVGNKSFGTTGAATNPGTGTVVVPSTPSDYAAYAKNFVYSGVTIPGCAASDAAKAQIFVGQRAEAFAVNLGPTFDLIDAPLGVVANGGVAAGGYAAVPNPLAKKNVTSIAIEVPADCIYQSAAQPAVGIWTTASVPQARVVNPAATYAQPSFEGGAWTQVSRLGNPLVNEVVIGLPDKDKFNSSNPADDVANFAAYVEYPTLPAVIDIVFGTDLQPTVFPRLDLVEAFLTGIPTVNAIPQTDGGAKVVPYDALHLNTTLSALLMAGPTPAGSQNRFGAAQCVVVGVLKTSMNPNCDPFGFPNGRRPIDDVVDLALDAMEGYLLTSGAPAYSGGSAIYFTDGVDQGGVSFLGDPAPHATGAATTATFPYLNTPTPGANGDGT